MRRKQLLGVARGRAGWNQGVIEDMPRLDGILAEVKITVDHLLGGLEE